MDLSTVEQNVAKFLLDQSHFMVKFFSEWLEYLLIKEMQMLFMSHFIVKIIDTVLQKYRRLTVIPTQKKSYPSSLLV